MWKYFINRYRWKRPKVDANIFDSALSHTRRSDASKKRRKYSRPLLAKFDCGQVSSPRLYRLNFLFFYFLIKVNVSFIAVQGPNGREYDRSVLFLLWYRERPQISKRRKNYRKRTRHERILSCGRKGFLKNKFECLKRHHLWSTRPQINKIDTGKFVKILASSTFQVHFFVTRQKSASSTYCAHS